jgi:hypothetical protein
MVARVQKQKSLNSMTPETSLRHQSYTWVILTASSQNNNCHHIRCRKTFKDWPLNEPLIPPNSYNLQHSQQGKSSPGKPPPSPSSIKLKIKDQVESNSVTSWTPSPWKDTSHCTTLKKVGTIYPHCCWLQTCLHMNWQTNRWVSCTTCDSLTHFLKT